MTQNQINYWNYRETNRHNVVSETETNRHNIVTENETGRHNLATEGETHRHNIVTEGIDLGKLQETSRHNQTTEALGFANLGEVSRHNMAQEALGGANISLGYSQLGETTRHNQAMEEVNYQSAKANNALSYARAALTRTQNRWTDVLNNANIKLTDEQRRKISSEISSLQTQVRKMESDINHQSFQNFDILYDDFTDAWDKANGTIDAIIPF